ncbi:MAG: AsmA family protein [Candidatus Schekmanbacteria bacterium]|nr:AsmA family protein [Candidatus Schekmanbacteria bacterium]
MKKWLIIFGIIVVVVIALIFAGLSNLGLIIKNAINSYGPGITKTDLSVGDVSVSLFSGKAKLKDFYLGNPGGFKSPQAVKVKSIAVDVDEKSINKDVIVIDRIEILQPEISYEMKNGTDNFKKILDNMKRDNAPKEKSSEIKDGKKGKEQKIIIKDLLITDGKVNVTTQFLAEKNISIPLPEIHLANIGNAENGTTPEEIAKQILQSLQENLTSAAVTDAINSQLKDLGINVDVFGKRGQKDLDKLTNKLKGLLGK